MGFYVGLSSNGTADRRAAVADRIAGDRLRLRRHQPRRDRRRPRPLPPPGRRLRQVAPRHAPLPRPRHQGRPALHRHRATTPREPARACSTSWRRRRSTSSTSRTWSTPAAATATAATTPCHRTTRAAMDLAVRALPATRRRRPAGPSSSPATTTPTASTSCTGSRAATPSGPSHMRAKLERWGGNASGVNVANIDNLGNVHPDTFWWHYSLGNVRERPFGEIWQDLSDPIMAGPEGEAPRGRRAAAAPAAISRSAAATRACAPCDLRRRLGRGPRLLPHRRGDRP